MGNLNQGNGRPPRWQSPHRKLVRVDRSNRRKRGEAPKAAAPNTDLRGHSDLAYELVHADRNNWRKRAEAAEAVAKNALALKPFPKETAEQFADRIRWFADRHHPELIIRFEHARIEVLPWAEDCGCDPNSDGYDDDHCESDEGGEYLCARGHLGFVCDTCVNEKGNGPDWAPDRYVWPCPPVARLEEVAGHGA